MNKNEKEARDWLLNEENLGTDNYDLDLSNRRLVGGIEYESGENTPENESEGKILEYSLEEEKLEINGQEYTALRAYDSEGLAAAEIYPGDGSTRKPASQFEDMNFTKDRFPTRTALSIVNALQNENQRDDGKKDEEREKAVAGAADSHDLEFDLEEL